MKEVLDVVLDIDGFLADFEGFYCDVYGYDNRHLANLVERHPTQEKSIKEFVASPNTYKYLKPIQAGVEIAQWLGQRMHDRQPRAHVEIVTGRPMAAIAYTRKWLSVHRVPYANLVCKPRLKEDYILSLHPDVVCDDIIGILTRVYQAQPKAKGILMAQPWNEDTIFFPRISTFEDFRRIYDKVANENLLTDFRGARMA